MSSYRPATGARRGRWWWPRPRSSRNGARRGSGRPPGTRPVHCGTASGSPRTARAGPPGGVGKIPSRMSGSASCTTATSRQSMRIACRTLTRCSGPRSALRTSTAVTGFTSLSPGRYCPLWSCSVGTKKPPGPESVGGLATRVSENRLLVPPTGQARSGAQHPAGRLVIGGPERHVSTVEGRCSYRQRLIPHAGGTGSPADASSASSPALVPSSTSPTGRPWAARARASWSSGARSSSVIAPISSHPAPGRRRRAPGHIRQSTVDGQTRPPMVTER